MTACKPRPKRKRGIAGRTESEERMSELKPCTEWSGSTKANGYGMFGGRLAHRLAWESANGPVPSGKMVLHRCNNKRCVNPDHLYIGGAKENTLDSIAAGTWTNPNPRRPTCKRGHSMDNAHVYFRGAREVHICRQCRAMRSRAFRARNAASR